MQKTILLIITMLFMLACETGTRYDTNITKEKVPDIEKVPKYEAQSSIVKSNDIEDLLDNDELEGEPYYDDSQDEGASYLSSTLDVIKIREGKHDGYFRLVLDINNQANTAKNVGHYDATFSEQKNKISVIFHDYKNFSAPLPTFSSYSLLEQIYVERYRATNGFKLDIKLRENAEVKIFDLKNPARLVFDIKAI